MKIPRPLFYLLLCGAGLLGGLLGKRSLRSQSAALPKDFPASDVRPIASAFKPETTAPPLPVHSTDTGETLLALDDPSLYPRLALWLLDAGETDISAFWQNYRQRPAPDSKITLLVFVNWTRLNPQAAIAADGTEAMPSWQAWACNDPEKALAAAIAAGAGPLQAVISEIAEYHPKWLRAHFERLQEEAKPAALSAMRFHADTSDPTGMMEFAQRCQDPWMISNAFRAMIEKDPFSAWDWLQKNPALAPQYVGTRGSAMEALVLSIPPSRIGDLERIAALTPPGETRRMMETEIFKNLVSTDPEAALAEAKTIKAPRIAAHRLAQVGKAYIQSNPGKAFEVAEALFSVCPTATVNSIRVTFPDGSDSWSDEASSEVYQLLTGLATKDPGRTLDLILPGTPDPSKSDAFSTLTQTWAERDLDSYTRWVNEQTDPLVREPAARLVVSRLESKQQYAEALEWAMSLGSSQASRPEFIYRKWEKNSPQEAQAWLESANLPPDRKTLLEKGGSK